MSSESVNNQLIQNDSFLVKVIKSFGLPRLIITLFLMLMFVLAPFVGANFFTQLSNTLNRFSWNAVLVLAMVPMIHSGCGLNFGLPLGIIAGLLGATLSIELGAQGASSFWMAILLATPFALIFVQLWSQPDYAIKALLFASRGTNYVELVQTSSPRRALARPQRSVDANASLSVCRIHIASPLPAFITLTPTSLPEAASYPASDYFVHMKFHF